MRNYFKSTPKNAPSEEIGRAEDASKRQTPPMDPFSEKSAPSINDVELQPPAARYANRSSSRPASLSGRSVRSSVSSAFIEDIKHEVMVNYLYQQQCSHLWVSSGSGEIEGCILRKSRTQYMACPPELVNSPFATACGALNVHVSQLLVGPNLMPRPEEEAEEEEERKDQKLTGHTSV